MNEAAAPELALKKALDASFVTAKAFILPTSIQPLMSGNFDLTLVVKSLTL